MSLKKIEAPHWAPYRPDIDGLRALAVCAVVVYHAFPELLPGGFVGVDVFFVISGFLIHNILFRELAMNQFSFMRFYTRRIKRILPALTIVLTVVIAFGWFFLLAEDYKNLGLHTFGGSVFISNFLLWHESGYFDKSSDSKPLLHLWSLAIEEQFYIFWPLVLAFFYRTKINISTILTITILLSFGYNILIGSHSMVADFYSPATRFWEILVGGILTYSLRSPLRNKIQNNLLSISGMTLILISILCFNGNSPYPSWRGLFPVLGAVFIIASGSDGLINRLLKMKGFVGIGLISYSLYLWHWPILSFLRAARDEPNSPLLQIGGLFISVILAFLSFKWVETPTRRSNSRYGLSGVLLITLFGLGWFGINVYKREGLAFRPIQQTDKDNYDWKTDYRYGKCFLDKEIRFSPLCDGNRTSLTKEKPLIALWGDSHAASLYQGLKHNAEKSGYDLAQFTRAGCPPILGFRPTDDDLCEKSNEEVFSRIKNLRADSVILGGYWNLYNGKKGWGVLDFSQLSTTIKKLKSTAPEKIVLFGPLPIFKIAQPKVARKIFIKNVKNRTNRYLDTSTKLLDEKLKSFANEMQIEYISVIDLLCTDDGCLISTSISDLIPLAYDYGHLTQEGSKLLIQEALKGKN